MTLDYEVAREQLVRWLRKEIRDERVLAAMRDVPREAFVPPDVRRYAYDDRPLPIGYGQTISQPLIVALMTAALDLSGDERVLEIGTGSGYQAAILSRLCRHVVSVERVPELAERAAETLRLLGYDNVEVHVARDSLGWPEGAPYDAVLVTAAAPRIPRALLNQLAPAGRMVVPVGSRRVQQLVRLERTDRGPVLRRLGECRFVPLIGLEAWKPVEAEEWYEGW